MADGAGYKPTDHIWERAQAILAARGIRNPSPQQIQDSLNLAGEISAAERRRSHNLYRQTHHIVLEQSKKLEKALSSLELVDPDTKTAAKDIFDAAWYRIQVLFTSYPHQNFVMANPAISTERPPEEWCEVIEEYYGSICLRRNHELAYEVEVALSAFEQLEELEKLHLSFRDRGKHSSRLEASFRQSLYSLKGEIVEGLPENFQSLIQQ
jgi:hypothetical protein